MNSLRLSPHLISSILRDNHCLQIYPVALNSYLGLPELSKKNFLVCIKVIPGFCIAHSFCPRFLRHQRAHMSARVYKT